MTSSPFRGAGTALITPFTHSGDVDLARMKELVERQIAGGIDFVVPCGTTGEAVTLSSSEYEAVIGITVDVAAGRIPVIAGVGSNSTKKTIENSNIAEHCSVDGILVVGPYYNKPTQDGFYQHFRAVSEAVTLPIVLYNVPSRTGSNITAETQLKIAEIDTVVATKEASGNFSQVMQILAKRRMDFRVLSGDDAITLPLIAAGADGVISVVANEVPREFSELVHAALDGRLDHARTIHYRLFELMEVNFIESSPIPVKAAMAMMGLIDEVYRLPMVPISDAGRKELATVLHALHLIR